MGRSCLQGFDQRVSPAFRACRSASSSISESVLKTFNTVFSDRVLPVMGFFAERTARRKSRMSSSSRLSTERSPQSGTTCFWRRPSSSSMVRTGGRRARRYAMNSFTKCDTAKRRTERFFGFFR
ncbi:MAG: hypothetical protein CMN31_04025 [Sandaracinus sp.]|nr:hypothetical protein [Sandaracinus sp.]MBJ70526.1 hypothetical protein [Sandaracinus sp.]